MNSNGLSKFSNVLPYRRQKKLSAVEAYKDHLVVYLSDKLLMKSVEIYQEIGVNVRLDQKSARDRI